MPHKKTMRNIYIIGLHILLIALLWNRNMGHNTLRSLNLLAPTQAIEMGADYHEKVAAHMHWQALIPDQSIILLGDSITEQIPPQTLPTSYINLGIGNDTSLGLINRLHYYPALKKSRAIVIAIGINDLLHRSVKLAGEHYKQLIAQLSPMAPVYVSLILPIDPAASNFINYKNRNNHNIDNYNRMITNICHARPNCYITDSTSALKGPSGSLRAKYHRGDGIHLSKEGYDIWLKELKNTIG